MAPVSEGDFSAIRLSRIISSLQLGMRIYKEFLAMMLKMS
jgi:hypothetical protein